MKTTSVPVGPKLKKNEKITSVPVGPKLDSDVSILILIICLLQILLFSNSEK